MKGIVTQEEYGGLPDVLQQEYTEGEDGRFYAKVEGVDGWEFQNVESLRTTMRTERQRRQEWERKHRDLEAKLGGIDVGELDSMKSELERLRKLPDESKTSERIKALETEYAQKLRDAESRTTQEVSVREERIKRLVIDSRSRRLLADAKCLDPDLFVDTIYRTCQVGEGDRVLVVDSHGDPVPTKKAGSVGNMTLEEYIDILKAQHPRNFKGSGASGGGADPAGAGGAGTHASGIPNFDKLPPDEKLKAIRRAGAKT